MKQPTMQVPKAVTPQVKQAPKLAAPHVASAKLPQVPGAHNDPEAKLSAMQRQQNVINGPRANAEKGLSAGDQAIADKLMARLSARK